MTDSQIMLEIQMMLDRLCSNLHMDVDRDIQRPTILLGIGHLLYSFPIDKIEWIKNTSKTARTHLIQHRLLETLQSLQNLLNIEIERIKQWQ